MPAHRTSRADLRLLTQMGDVDAAVELAERCRAKSLKALLAAVCEFEVVVTPDLFDTVADAAARLDLPAVQPDSEGAAA